jgi:preprotein translocase subunit SecA
MLRGIREEVTRVLMTVRIQSPEEIERVEQQVEREAGQSFAQASYTHADFTATPDADPESVAVMLQETPASTRNADASPGALAGKVGRNDPCPCGSGKKYKQCHGKLS